MLDILGTEFFFWKRPKVTNFQSKKCFYESVHVFDQFYNFKFQKKNNNNKSNKIKVMKIQTVNITSVNKN